VIFDPTNRLGRGVLRAFVNVGGTYQVLAEPWFAQVGLGLLLWQGTFEGHTATWLRWCDQERRIIPTGQERATQMEQKWQQEQEARERLEAKLRELGVDPKTLS